jgi:hypothetical protein
VDQLLNNDGLWDSHSQLMQAFEAYRTWIKKTLAPTTGIKKVEASTRPEPSEKPAKDNRTSDKASGAGYGDTRTRDANAAL